MGGGGDGGEELREAVLDFDAWERVEGVVAGPEGVEVAEDAVVDASAAAGAGHHFDVGVVLGDAGHDVVEGVVVVDPEVSVVLRV